MTGECKTFTFNEVFLHCCIWYCYLSKGSEFGPLVWRRNLGNSLNINLYNVNQNSKCCHVYRYVLMQEKQGHLSVLATWIRKYSHNWRKYFEGVVFHPDG